MKYQILAALFLVALITLDAANKAAARPPAGTGAAAPAQAAPVSRSNATGFITNSTEPMLRFDVQATNQLGQLTNPFGPGMNSAGSGAGQFELATNPVAFDTNFLAVDTNAFSSPTPGHRILLNGDGQFDISANGGLLMNTNRANVMTNFEPTGFTNFPNRIFPNPTNMLQLNPHSQ